nr:MAG TPA: hypothetical protein [Caudoviricetes sp.]
MAFLFTVIDIYFIAHSLYNTKGLLLHSPNCPCTLTTSKILLT